MKIVLQRVSSARVVVEDKIVGQIGAGYLVFLGIEKGDTPETLDLMVGKIARFRCMSDSAGRMNLALADVGGRLLVVSQFTLGASWRKGNRPGFDNAAAPDFAERMYEDFVRKIRAHGIEVQTGVFGVKMDVHLVNDGPVTFIFDDRDA